jgi:phage terminase large subunit-like protein
MEFGLRLGRHPHVLVTTTPRPIPIIRTLLSDSDFRVVRGASYENLSNLSARFIRRVIRKYEGTRLGRQELHAHVLLDLPGALWTNALIEKQRVNKVPPLVRIVVAVDPAASAEDDSNETGIIVAGKDARGHAYTLVDASGVYSPAKWAMIAVALYHAYQADRIVYERNQGGDMVERVIRVEDPDVPLKGIVATKNKVTRAEPVAALMETGRDHHVGSFPELEDQMTHTRPEGYVGAGSPDRMDAKVWATTDLLLNTDDDGDWTAHRR